MKKFLIIFYLTFLFFFITSSAYAQVDSVLIQYSSPERELNVEYQNTNENTIYVSVSVQTDDQPLSIRCALGETSADSIVDTIDFTNTQAEALSTSCAMFVPVGWWYAVIADQNQDDWVEWELISESGSSSTTTSEMTINNPNDDFMNGILLFLIGMFSMIWLFAKKR